MIHPILSQLVSGSQVPHIEASNKQITDGLNILYGVVGALTVLMLVIAGLRYVLASGEANKVGEAKRMIVYTLVGAIVIALASTIVEFVLKQQT